MWPQKDLFHYTSAEAFLGIFRSRAIWASNISLLNDEKEYRHTVELLNPHLNALRKRKEHIALVELLSKLIEDAEGGPTYVTSLSEKPDLLSQWRAYCRDGGYSIGFEKNSLRKIAERFSLTLVKCNYNPNEQKKMVAEFAFKLSSVISSEGTMIRDRNQALQFYVDHVYKQLNALANEIKHPAFEEEQEWRFVKTFVHANHPNLRYRTGRGMLIPYYEISLVSSNEGSESFPPISEIYIAPHKNSKLSEKTMRTFLAGEKSGFPDAPFIPVRRSNAPYREI